MIRIKAEEILKLREEIGCSLKEAHNFIFIEKLLELTDKAETIDDIKDILIKVISLLPS